MTTPGEPASTRPRIGVLWRGDPAQPVPKGDATRLRDIFRSLSQHGAEAMPIVFADETADRALGELLACDGVLVWVDPIVDGVNRSVLDETLRSAASHGVYVSAHPDTVLKLGTKDVLYTTRKMSWGTDVRLYADARELAEGLPQALDTGPRVLKQHRGNGGNGVWRIEWMPTRRDTVSVLHGLRGSAVESMPLADLARRLEPYFAGGACMVDQAFQPRLRDGMVRCYIAGDRVAGFGFQLVTALLAANEPGSETPPPPLRVYFGPDEPRFQAVRYRMESEWLPDLLRTLDLTPHQLPAVWDVDLLLGATSRGRGRLLRPLRNQRQLRLPHPRRSSRPAGRSRAQAIARRAGPTGHLKPGIGRRGRVTSKCPTYGHDCASLKTPGPPCSPMGPRAPRTPPAARPASPAA